jgi:hypothetical protein
VIHGSCLCGRVRLDIAGTFERAPEACHCTQCRKHTGHFLAAVNVRRTALTIHGNEHVKWYQSSEKVQRGFCSNCGSTLFWNPTIDGYQWTAVAMGTLDTPSGVRLSKHTFVGDKGDYYDITDGLPQSAGF